MVVRGTGGRKHIAGGSSRAGGHKGVAWRTCDSNYVNDGVVSGTPKTAQDRISSSSI